MPFRPHPNRPKRFRARYRIRNWREYEAGLKRRGDLTLWLDEAAIAGWHASRRTTSGGQALYSDLAIELVLALQLAFHLALRQAEGFASSVLRLLSLDLPVPDHTTLSRRSRTFASRRGERYAPALVLRLPLSA
jgi:hypothetical protein